MNINRSCTFQRRTLSFINYKIRPKGIAIPNAIPPIMAHATIIAAIGLKIVAIK